jgi:hypothetical protein
MPHLAPLVAGASLLLWVPLAAQTGLSSVPGSIALSATHPSSVGVMVPGTVTPGLSLSLVADSTGRLALTSRWNVDPAQPVIVTLAFVEGPAELRLFTPPIAPLVGRGGRTDHVQVRTSGTLTVAAITQ